jgi:uncharacterized membrane protein
MAVAAVTGRARVPSPDFLSAAGVFWFAVMLIGQWAFFYYIVAFYGASTLSGDLEIWNRLAALGRRPYVEGDTFGNAAYASHALAAGVVAFGGILQLVPWIRKHAPTFHRWNGRLFLFTVIGLSFSGFYLVWIRGTSPSFIEGISTTLNGVLILTFAALALRNAMARDIDAHRRWAMRLYLVSNAQWFLRVGFFAYFVIGGAAGVEVGFGDPIFKFWTWGCYVFPLAVLQVYFLAQNSGGALGRAIVGAGLVGLTLAMGVGVFAFSMFSQAVISGAPIGLPG